MIRKILRRMMEGGDINSIARDLGIERGTLDAILEMAVRGGYLEKVDVSSSCNACFLHRTCRIEPPECDKTEMYIITPKGERYAGFNFE